MMNIMNHSQAKTKLSEIRCQVCKRLLARADVEVGALELYCSRCKITFYLRASRPNLAPHDGLHGDRHDLKTPQSRV